MTRNEAEEVLGEIAGEIDAAVLHFDTVIADAHHSKVLAMKAWRDWDLDTLRELGILDARRADLAEAALETLDR